VGASAVAGIAPGRAAVHDWPRRDLRDFSSVWGMFLHAVRTLGESGVVWAAPGSACASFVMSLGFWGPLAIPRGRCTLRRHISSHAMSAVGICVCVRCSLRVAGCLVATGACEWGQRDLRLGLVHGLDARGLC
jgi:hypothetical protein